MKKLIAISALFFACGRLLIGSLPAVNVAASVFTNCAKVCINREIQVPDCSFPDIGGLNRQLADYKDKLTASENELAEIKKDHLTEAECQIISKASAALDKDQACPAAAAPAAAMVSDINALLNAAQLRECASAKLVYMGLMNKKTITAGTSVKCDNATFGDPVKNKPKKCYIDGVAKADEDGGFSMEFDGMVAYGLITQLDYSETGTTALECTNARFGDKDPIPGMPKKCYDSKGNELANEGKTFTPPNPKPTGC